MVNYVEGDDAANAVVHRIKNFGGNALVHKADVSSEDEVGSMFDRAVRELGTIDILVSNAGLQRDAAFHEMTLEQWNAGIGVNLTGQFTHFASGISMLNIDGAGVTVALVARMLREAR